MSTRAPRRTRTVASSQAIARHDEAVIQAEVRRLALALAPFGVLSREALRKQVGGDQWREGSFEQALSCGVRTGALEELAGDFYREAR